MAKPSWVVHVLLAFPVLCFLGCDGPGASSSRVDPGTSDVGEELDSQDIVVMTRQMAEDLSKVQFPSDVLPARIVMKWVKNETATIRYMNRITLAGIRVQLQQNVPRTKMVFLMENDALQNLRADEGVAEPGESGMGRAVKPSYALMGAFYDHPSRGAIYYLCTFQLAHIGTGALVWEHSYEVKRLRR